MMGWVRNRMKEPPEQLVGKLSPITRDQQLLVIQNEANDSLLSNGTI